MMATLTPVQEEMLTAIRSAGDWIDRGDLAQQLGKKRLNKWHDKLLADLLEMGVIEQRTVPHTSPIGFKYEYRAK